MVPTPPVAKHLDRIDLSLIQGTKVEQEPRQLSGAPPDWYNQAPAMTLGEQQRQLNVGDWVIRPHHMNFMVMLVSKQTLMRLDQERTNQIRNLVEMLRDRERVRTSEYESVRASFDQPDNPYQEIDQLVAAHPGMSDDERVALATEQVEAQPSALRVLLQMKAVLPAWTQEDMLRADRGPLPQEFAPNQARILWMRRQDARWRPVISGLTSTVSVDDAQMSHLNPRPVVIQEVEDANENPVENPEEHPDEGDH